MDRTLTRLRIAFVLLGALLLAPLFVLVRSAHARLEEQRRLRHEIVAERIFDEMERELTALLERERDRPAAAYDAPHTRAETWAPFVVGYFTRDLHGVRVIARDQLDGARAARVEQAADGAWRGAARAWVTAQGEPPAGSDVDLPAAAAPERPTEAAVQPAAAERARKDEDKVTQQDAVLRKLNRAAKSRAKRPARGDAKSLEDRLQDDPLVGLDSL